MRTISFLKILENMELEVQLILKILKEPEQEVVRLWKILKGPAPDFLNPKP